jgi:mono/diheme cytochrome c family protein
MQPGVIPYSVNAELWSDGAYKERFIAIPGDKPWIALTQRGGWNFPDGTVLVKSFALEMEEGKPDSRRWIETRFFTKQQKEWAGYSYVWNEEQTDATLVSAGGLDREFVIRVPRSPAHPSGTRTQIWHYPSRTECMVCHSRAANFVLGPSTLQMNREHDYGGVRDNQLRTLEHLGLFQTDLAAVVKNALYEEATAQGLKGKERDNYIAARAEAPNQRAAARSKQLPLAPQDMPRLVNPYDATAELELRARSYLHANCAHCHVEAGGGNARFNADFFTRLADTRLVDVAPQHGMLDVHDALLIAPGAPARSVLLARMARRGTGQMPPLATSLADRQALKLMEEWINQMKPAPK